MRKLVRRWVLRLEECEGDRKEDHEYCIFGVAQMELARWFP